MEGLLTTNIHILSSTVPYFTSFRFSASSIAGLWLGLVVGLGTVLVLFFYCIFTALHKMQTRSSDENSVRLFVRPSVCLSDA